MESVLEWSRVRENGSLSLNRANCECYVDLSRTVAYISTIAPHENLDDCSGALLRAPGYTLQRIPPHPGAHRTRPYRRSRDVSVWSGRLTAGLTIVSIAAAAVCSRDWHRPLMGKGAA